MIQIVLIMMVVCAIFAVQTNTLRRAIVYLCVFSLLCSFSYLLYQAPDVAIAEAIIGSTLSTILYLVALKKYKVFRVYYTAGKLQMQTDHTTRGRTVIINVLRKFALETELELDIVHTSKDVEEIKDAYPYDIIIDHELEGIIIHGDRSNYHFDDVRRYFFTYAANHVTFNYLESEGDTDL